MDINFSLNVDDEVVATEHVWHNEWHNDPQPPETPEIPPETPEKPPVNPPETPDPKPEDPTKRKFTFKLKVEEEPEIVEIPEEEIPLVNIPDEEIPLTNIPDEPVPLTGDSMFWYITGSIAALALSVLALGKKEKKNHNA